jgi:malate dehydrogenase (oxaloacetate-decarboxylating)(NADP+)
MFMSAAATLANLVSEADLAQGSFFPALHRISEVPAHIAAAVAKVAYDQGLADGEARADLLTCVQSKMYESRCFGYV